MLCTVSKACSHCFVYSMVGTLRTDLDGVKESKSVDSGDSAKQLLQRLEVRIISYCPVSLDHGAYASDLYRDPDQRFY